MPDDVFGRKLKNKKKELKHGPPGAGYKFTPAGDYDVECKRLCNVASSTEPFDAVNLSTLTQAFEKHNVEKEKEIEDMLDELKNI